MIKKLKRRLIAISMLLVCVVLALFYLVVCGAISISMRSEVRDILEDYAELNAQDILPSLGPDGNDAYGLYKGNVCVVGYSSVSGMIHILDGSSAFMNDDMLIRAVSGAVASKEKFGSLDDLGLFFFRSDSLIGCTMAFTSMSLYESYLKSMLIVGGVVFLIAVVVLYLINVFLSNMSLKPLARAWEQQQNFIADASHELKTPLTVILTNGNILQSHKNDTVGEQIKWIDSTNEEATHMKELVDKLLLLAKTDNMRQNKMFTDVDMTELIMRLVLQFDPVAYEKGVLINADIGSDIHIHGDQTALNQIGHILIDNAVKYAGIGGEVTLSLKKKQNYVYLSAKNTGTPIPPEDLPHIFERFYRSDKARTSGSGYGLGLAICKNLAELHRADITVTSNAVDGTLFTVRFRCNNR